MLGPALGMTRNRAVHPCEKEEETVSGSIVMRPAAQVDTEYSRTTMPWLRSRESRGHPERRLGGSRNFTSARKACYGFRPQIPGKDWKGLEKPESAPEPQLQGALSNILPRHHFGGPPAQPAFTLLAVFETAAFNHSTIVLRTGQRPLHRGVHRSRPRTFNRLGLHRFRPPRSEAKTGHCPQEARDLASHRRFSLRDVAFHPHLGVPCPPQCTQ
jgi:hypothetical protein